MIARDLPDQRSILIRQEDHADLSSQFASHWGNDRVAAPTPYDAARLADVNAAWNILPGPPPAIDGSFKGRLRGLVWRLVGPALETQQRFNAALVDHLNRTQRTHEETTRAVTSVLTALKRTHRIRTYAA